MECIRILLAEDDYDDKNLFHEYLDNRNDIVILPIVETGKELFECLNKMKATDFPDWIILDQNLPIKSGLEILDQLKSSSTYCSIPVIIYSTYTDNHLINEGRRKGALMVLSKPLTKKGYNEMIDQLLRYFAKPA